MLWQSISAWSDFLCWAFVHFACLSTRFNFFFFSGGGGGSTGLRSIALLTAWSSLVCCLTLTIVTQILRLFALVVRFHWVCLHALPFCRTVSFCFCIVRDICCVSGTITFELKPWGYGVCAVVLDLVQVSQSVLIDVSFQTIMLCLFSVYTGHLRTICSLCCCTLLFRVLGTLLFRVLCFVITILCYYFLCL